MKALIKSGLVVALGWLASAAGAQEVPIKWQASGNKNAGTAVRPVTLSQPTPLDGFTPVVRGQAPDDKNAAPLPKLEIIIGDPKGAQKLPADKEKDKPKSFTPPPPQPMPTPAPMPITESLMPDGCGFDDCGPLRGRRFFWGNGDCCPDRPCFWMTAEYLMWWTRSQSVPPLVTGTPFGSTAPIGVLPGATVLYDNVPNPMRSGARFTVGCWLPHFCDRLGVEFSYFFLGRQGATSDFGPGTGLALGRPFFSVINNANNAEVFNAADRTGFASISTFTNLWGMEANLRHKWLCGPSWWVDCLAGYRHLNLNEGISISESLTITTPGINQGTSFVEHESFGTRNLFNGGQFGIEGECRIGNRCFVGWSTKLAVGSVYQIINTDATTTRTLPGGAPQTQQGALLITQTNQGKSTSTAFAVLPEVGIKLGYDCTDHLRIFVGYNFLYLSNVVRPGDQIDPRVNSELRPFTGNTTSAFPRVPQVPFKNTDYWAQGLNFGLQYRY